MGAKVVGYKELLHKLHRFSVDAPVATAFGLYEGAQNIMVDAKGRAPKDTTAMARSGYVTPPEIRSGADIRIDMGFGGDSSEYVVRQHEQLDLPHPRGGQARFLSNAIDAGAAQLMAAVKRSVMKFMLTRKTSPPPKIVPSSPLEDRVP